MTNLPEFNYNSTQHLSLLLFGGMLAVEEIENLGFYKNGNPKTKKVKKLKNIQGLGIKPLKAWKTKRDGIYSTDDTILQEISKTKHEFKRIAELMLEIRALTKELSTYYESTLEHIYPDECVHSQYNHVSTNTGRLSCKSPNVQNSPTGKSKVPEHFISRFEKGQVVSADYCLDPNTRILTEDFVWKPIKDINIGECLVGFEEQIRTHDGRKFKQAIVTNKKNLIKEGIKIITSEGVLICSLEHQWIASQGTKNTTDWVKAEDLCIGDRLCKVSEVWESPNTYEAGWMAGILDGEGYLEKGQHIGCGQNPGIILDTYIKLFNKYLINSESHIDTTYKCHKVRPRGLRTGWQAVGIFQCKRLKQKLQKTYIKQSIRSKRNRKVIILDIIPLGMIEVVAIETTTKTFLAEGLLSHNCGLEVRVEAQLSGDVQYMSDIINNVDFHIKNLALKEGMDYTKVAELVATSDEWSAKRSQTKGFTFAQQYGAGNKKISEQTGFSEEEVQKIRDERKKTYPRLHMYYDWLKIEVNKKGEYSDPWGRKYVFKKYPPRFNWQKEDTYSPTEVQNYRTQGYATATIVLSMLGKFWREKALLNRDKYLLINTIHDSVMLDCREEYLEDAKKDLTILTEVGTISKQIFDYNFIIPIEIEVKYGKSWSEL